MNKFRWPPDKALQELSERADQIDSLFIAVRFRDGRHGVIASGMSESDAMRAALKFLLGAKE